MSLRIRIAGLLLVLALLTAACKAAPTAVPIPPTRVSPSPTAAPSPTAIPTLATPRPTTPPPTPAGTATPASTPQPTATATRLMTSTPEPHIILSTVSSQADTPGLLHVAGRAQVFEATLSLRLKTVDGKVIARGVTRVSRGAPDWGELNVDIVYPPPTLEQRAVLEAFEESMKDGSEQNLVSAPVMLRPAPELAKWKAYTNPALSFQVRYPPTWFLNQGTFGPPPPATTKFSTYSATAEVKTLGPGDAEVWIGASDAPSLAEMQDLEAKGYQKRLLVVAGRSAVRYTDSSPHHGIYDVVYTVSGTQEYRIHLSAASHAFDATFNLLLSTLTLPGAE